MKSLVIAVARVALVIAGLLVLEGTTEAVTILDGRPGLALDQLGGATGDGFVAWLLLLELLGAVVCYLVVVAPSPRPQRRPVWANAAYVLSLVGAVGVVAVAWMHAHLGRLVDSHPEVSWGPGTYILLVGLAFGALGSANMAHATAS